MSKALASLFLITSLFLCISTADNGFPRCNCDEEGYWSVENILEGQRVSDFLIALAYFSIPIELLYFVRFSSVPFKWVLFQFILFIVLCGMTHFLNGWTYGPHSFQLMLALTIFKFLTALVSFATAITLITLIPLLLKIKVRELMLRKKTWDLDREVGIIKRQEEAGWHVRMLTQEIRKSLDRHTILETTLVELSKALNLQSCAIWMPNTGRTEISLAHDLKGRNFSNTFNPPIPTSDPVVREIKGTTKVKILDPESTLAVASSGGQCEQGAVAAIRMPMLRVANFTGHGTPEMVPACYAILVLVLPEGHNRSWSKQELEIVEVVADQVAVAISHAAILEESQNMREKLVEQNRALQRARKDALMANQTRNEFQNVMSNGLRRPMHSILGLLSVLQDDVKLNNDQHLLVDTLVKTSNVLSTLVTDVMDTSLKDNGRFPLQMRCFQLHDVIKEAACVSKCLCAYSGCGFVSEVEKVLPNFVVGDERRVFQVVLQMVRNLLSGCKIGGTLTLRVFLDSGSLDGKGQRWTQWRSELSYGYVCVRIEVGIRYLASRVEDVSAATNTYGCYGSAGVEESMSFSACKRLVQLMQGDIWEIRNPEGFNQSMALVLRLQSRPSIPAGTISDQVDPSDHRCHSNSLFRGLKVLLADADYVNRAVTRKLLEKLGCVVSPVSSGYECLGLIGPASACQIVLLDLQLPDSDGFEVASRIRKFRSQSCPPIVALTANDDGEIRDRCLQIGINGIIRKPGTLGEISDELRRILIHANRGLAM